MIENAIVIGTLFVSLYIYNIPLYYFYYNCIVICILIVLTIDGEVKDEVSIQIDGFVYSAVTVNAYLISVIDSIDTINQTEEINHLITLAVALSTSSFAYIMWKITNNANILIQLFFWLMFSVFIAYNYSSALVIWMMYEFLSIALFTVVFPKSFSFGAMSIITHGFAFIGREFSETIKDFTPGRIEQDWNIQKRFFVIYMFIAATFGVIAVSPLIIIKQKNKKNKLISSFCDMTFYLVSICVMYITLVHVFALYFGKSIIFWFIDILLSNGLYIKLVCYWSSIVAICIGFVIIVVNREVPLDIPLTVVRKFFHIAAVMIFLPGCLDEHFLAMVSAVIFILFIVVEVIRCSEVQPFALILHKAFNHFRDEQDQGILTLTNIYLLFGLSLPFWLSLNKQNNLLNTKASMSLLLCYSGVISIGIGDAFASICGKLCAGPKWPCSKKTYIGTISCIFSQFFFTIFLLKILQLDLTMYILLLFFIVFIINSLLETFSMQVDNLILPIFTYILLQISCKFI